MVETCKIVREFSEEQLESKRSVSNLKQTCVIYTDKHAQISTHLCKIYNVPIHYATLLYRARDNWVKVEDRIQVRIEVEVEEKVNVQIGVRIQRLGPDLGQVQGQSHGQGQAHGQSQCIRVGSESMSKSESRSGQGRNKVQVKAKIVVDV